MNDCAGNRGYRRMFSENRLSLGLFFAIESYNGSIPAMNVESQVSLAKRAEALGFSALWVRDVPLHDPTFGDAGQIFDPWVFLGYVAAHTSEIALATGSIIFPLRHPLDLAKAAASVDQLSRGRLVLGVASGDRPVEYPAYALDHATRGERFREGLRYFNAALATHFPIIDSPLGYLEGADLIPKPYDGAIPLLVTGHSQQSLDWIAENADGWITYPRSPTHQKQMVAQWRQLTHPYGFKPFAQSLYIDLSADPDADPVPMHLGYRLGRNRLIPFLRELEQTGVNHVAFNLKYGQRPAGEVLEELGQEVLPHFATQSGMPLP